MRKLITTIAVTGLISSMLVSSAFAGNRHLEVLNPLWLPVAILSTIAATVAVTAPQPVVYERHEYYEPRQRVIYEEPYYRHNHYYERGTVDYSDYGRDRGYERPQYREYR
ncbi:MAG: hypothetical protein HXX11_15150 [Desulfuromonadales bacterium]|nr:hypothetical protein [Desulfuromonadales bacterium]